MSRSLSQWVFPPWNAVAGKGAEAAARTGTAASDTTGAFHESVTLLLEAGSQVNLADNVEQFTALMFAAAEGQAEIVQILLDKGADKSLVDKDGDSAYNFAVANGHQAVAALLK